MPVGSANVEPDVTAAHIARAAQMPVPLTPLVGREAVLAAAAGLLMQPHVRLMTLTGQGGVGKTRLALALAWSVSGEFPDGTIFVPLAAVSDPRLVMPTIAQALHLRDDDSESPQDRLSRALYGKQHLLVLDNLEQIRAAGPEMTRLLAACPGLKLLTTSRVALKVQGEQEFAVSPLHLPIHKNGADLNSIAANESVRLFVQRARALRPDFNVTTENARAISAICHRLDGLPLALELAAGRIKVLSSQAILDRLDNRLTLLTGGGQDVPERQQTLRNTISWSYDLLTPHEQSLLRRLAVFVDGWTLEAAEAVVGADPETDVLEGLAALVDHQLVQSVDQPDGTSRFGMLAAIREYALERLLASNEREELGRRHADYYSERVHAASQRNSTSEQKASFDLIERDYGDIRAALDWLYDGGHIEQGLQLGSALWQFWEIRGYLTEGRRRISAFLDADESRSFPQARGAALFTLGRLCFQQGDYSAARTPLEERLILARQVGDNSRAAGALTQIGHIDRIHGDYQAARARYVESFAIRRADGNPWLIALSLVSIGHLALLEGGYAEARSTLQESLALFQESGRADDVIRSVTLLAQLATEEGRLDEARRLFEESIERAQELGYRFEIASAMSWLGQIDLDSGNLEGCRQRLAQSLTLYQELGVTPGIPRCLERFAELACAQDDPARAVRLASRAWALQATLATTPYPAWEARRQQLLQAARRKLAPADYDAAWSAGRMMSLDETIALALSDPSAPRTGETQPTPGPAAATGLTRRELEVLKLLVAGRSTVEIADTLYISQLTARTHIRNILAKLDVPSRTAAVAYAFQHELF